MKLSTINVIRSIAAIFILLFHYTYQYCETIFTRDTFSEENWPIHIYFGYGAISTFFILSGFLSSQIFIKNQSVKVYLTKRFFRLYPTFWLCLLISSIILMNSNYATVSLKNILLNMTMIPKVFNGECIDGAYWTMQMEFFFTLIICIMLIIKNVKAKIIILIMWTVSTVMFNIYENNSDNIAMRLFRVFLMPDYSSCFIGGISLYQLIFGYRYKYIFLITLFLSIISYYIVNSISTLFLFYISTVALLLLIKPIENKLKKFNRICSFFSFFAMITYPLYLIHQYFGYIIMDMEQELGLNNELIIIFPTIIMILLAFFIHVFFEKKVYRLQDRIISSYLR